MFDLTLVDETERNETYNEDWDDYAYAAKYADYIRQLEMESSLSKSIIHA